MKRTSITLLCVWYYFYQTEWFNNRSEKRSDVFNLVLLFCFVYDICFWLLARCSQLASDYSAHFLFMPAGAPAWGPRGVWGLLSPWYWYFAFFSLGFRICQQSEGWGGGQRGREMTRCLPGRSTSVSRPQTSSRRRYRTLHSSWGLRTGSPTASWRKTRNRLRQPGRIMLCYYVVVSRIPPGIIGLCRSLINKVWRSALVLRQGQCT